MLTEYFIPKASALDSLENQFFMQDGARPHTANDTIAILNQYFPKRFISIGKGAYLKWPPNSPDLSVCDFWAWGYIKTRVYETQPQSISQLVSTIKTEIAKIPLSMVAKAIDHFPKRLEACMWNQGGHIERKVKGIS